MAEDRKVADEKIERVAVALFLHDSLNGVWALALPQTRNSYRDEAANVLYSPDWLANNTKRRP